MGGVQETRIEVGPSWTAMRLEGAEAAVMKIGREACASLNIHMGHILKLFEFYNIRHTVFSQASQ